MQMVVMISPRRRWASRVMSGVPVLLLLLSAMIKLAKPAPAVQEFARFGFQESVIPFIAILELGCTALYLIPRTAVLGAILLTGYLGGAIVTHLRIGDSISNYGAFVLGVLLWGGLYLRDARVRALIPFCHHSPD